LHFAADRIALKVEHYIHVLAESARVVVTVGARIAKTFEYDVRLNEYIFNSEREKSKMAKNKSNK
jgi:hypothetical protein